MIPTNMANMTLPLDTRSPANKILVFALAFVVLGCQRAPVKGSTDTRPLSFYIAPQTGSERSVFERVAENDVAKCMKRRGFQYVPFVHEPIGGFEVGWQVDSSTRPTFLREFGYGISESLDRGRKIPDPNIAILEKLSQANRIAYTEAPTGTEGRVQKSCKGVANHVMDPNTVSSKTFEELDKLVARIKADQRSKTADQQWSACMATSGYPGIESPDSALMSVVEPQRQKMFTTWESLSDSRILQRFRDFEMKLSESRRSVSRAVSKVTFRNPERLRTRISF
jgi:hypothetical protein